MIYCRMSIFPLFFSVSLCHLNFLFTERCGSATSYSRGNGDSTCGTQRWQEHTLNGHTRSIIFERSSPYRRPWPPFQPQHLIYSPGSSNTAIGAIMYSQNLRVGMSGRPTKVYEGIVLGICRMFAGRYCCEHGGKLTRRM